MVSRPERYRVWIFLAFAFGIAWATGLVIYLTGGLANTPRLFGNLKLANVLTVTTYAWAPALANIFTRLVTHEGWGHTWLRPRLRRGWPYWLAAWVLPGLLVVLGMVIYYLLFPQHYDPTIPKMRASLQAAGRAIPASLWGLVIAQAAVAMLTSPVVNAITTFGEEFGWRAYLLPKIMPSDGNPAGIRKTLALMGLIWGVWHWPLIFMGYEYGFKYPGWPWLGPLVFIWFTFVAGVFLAWVALRGGSVWPAVIGHASINGLAGLSYLFLKGTPNPIVGPFIQGVVGGLAFTLLAVLLFLRPGAFGVWRNRETRKPAPALAAAEDAEPAPNLTHQG